jgi:hypothetical protein
MPWAERDVVTGRVLGVNAQQVRCLPALGCPSGLLRRCPAVSPLQSKDLRHPAFSA